MTPREAFKTGFMARCAEDGLLTAEQMLGAVKTAQDKLANILTDAAQGMGHFALHVGVPAALAAPPILGGMAGYGLAKATDIDDTDVDDIKDREVIKAYKTEAEKLRRQKTVRDFAHSRPMTGGRHYL